MRAVAESITPISWVRSAVLPLFLVSGAAGLIYEVAWTRAFGTVFGNTVFAVSTVLTAFMLGLALGSWLFGRLADKISQPLKLYALLELGIGVYALLFTSILAATDFFYGWFFRSFHPAFYSLNLVRFALSVVLLILPTALMGGTLPVLSKLRANPSAEKSSNGDRIGQNVGLLYAINTFGAVAGSFLSGYVLIRILGLSNTVYLAGAANLLVGVAAFALSRFVSRQRAGTAFAKPPTKQPSHAAGANKKGARSESGRRKTTEAIVAEKSEKGRAVVLVAVAVAGFCALALEVLWTRVLVFVLGTSVYAFVCMLTCFLLGIALGSFLCSRLLLGRIKNPVFALGVVELLVGVSALASITLLGNLWRIDYTLTWKLRASGFWKEVLAHFVDSSIVLLVPTTLMGAAFPIAVKGCAESWKAVGSRVGEVYASNTVGCVIGSFAAGFAIVPLFGLRDSFLIIISILLFLAVLVVSLSGKPRGRLAVPVGVVSAAAVIAGV